MNGGRPPLDEQGRLIVLEYDPHSGMEVPRALIRPRPRPFVRSDAQRASPTSLQFGVTDLVLNNDLSECTSALEYSYGIGLRPGSDDARTLLAGAHVFKPDAVELWIVSAEVNIETAMGGFGGTGSVAGAAAGGGASGSATPGGGAGSVVGGGDAQ